MFWGGNFKDMMNQFNFYRKQNFNQYFLYHTQTFHVMMQ